MGTKTKSSKSASFEKRVMKVLRKSDVLIEVLDARFPQETRNFRREKKTGWLGKGLVVVLNKKDIVSAEKLKQTKKRLGKKGFLVVETSCKNREGKHKLKGAIKTAAQALGKKAQNRISAKGMIIGVFGYPNTGKSSLINYLAGRKKARTSSQAAFTRGEQFIRISEEAMLIDTPGVVSFRGKPWQDLVLLNAISPNQIKDRVSAAERILKFLLENKPRAIETVYKFKLEGDEGTEQIIAKIAVARKRLVKGGEPDLETISRTILRDWLEGRLKI